MGADDTIRRGAAPLIIMEPAAGIEPCLQFSSAG